MNNMENSEEACVEYLRPQNVPEGLISLCTVVQILEAQIKVQITGGVICLVDQAHISNPYSNFIEQCRRGEKNPLSLPKLSQMFKKGQQLVCKIIEKRARKGYDAARDLIATFEPSSLQEDTLPQTLLSIPNVPIQCAVHSIEDYGYHMDIGFANITGFMTFDDADKYCAKNNNGSKLVIGQVVRCYTKSSLKPSGDTRIVHLSMKKEDRIKAKFSKEKVEKNIFTPECILPGSKSFLTVMKVRKDSLVVKLMNEFPAFVSWHHLKDDWQKPKEDYQIAQQHNCTVLYYNRLTKTFCVSLKRESTRKATIERFIKNYHVGKIIDEAQVAFVFDSRAVYFKLHDQVKAVANVKDAISSDLATMTRDEIASEIDTSFPDGSSHKCRIKSINYADLYLVLSLKQDLLEKPFVSVEELKAGDFVDATVKKHSKDGVVVSFGLNLRGLVLNMNLQDYGHVTNSKKYPIGKVFKCRVLKVDLIKQPPKVFLTNKDALMIDDLFIIDRYERCMKGKKTNATIIKVRQDGVIVELFNNVKGFIPRRFLSSTDFKNVSDLFSIGQVISCTVYAVNVPRKTLKLSVLSYKKVMEVKKTPVVRTASGASVSANVDAAVDGDTNGVKQIKSRFQRSEEARLREERLRETEKMLLDTDRPPQSMADFERLLIKTPNSADLWIKYSNFFLENIETEKARIVCFRALKTINFREEKEKLKIWLQLIKIEAKFGGQEKLKETINEALKLNDQLSLLQGAVRVLTKCNELCEAEQLYEHMVKSYGHSVEVWLDWILFHMEQRKDLDKARKLYESACKKLPQSSWTMLKSRFAQFEFKHGDIERGKTLFEQLLSDNPKRTDLWRVYEAMVRKYADESGEESAQLLDKISTNIKMLSKKVK